MILKGKHIIITGSEGLIGKAIVNDVKNEGGIPICLDIKLVTDVNNHKYKVDLTNKEDLIKSFDLISKKYKNLDGLVNNAYPRTSDWGETLENVELESFCTNVNWQMSNVFYIIKLFLETINYEKTISVVNMASIYGMVGNDFNIYNDTDLTSPVAYSAIKGGIINLTRYLSSYFGRRNMRFNSVSPGGVFDNQNMTFVKNYSDRVPMGRMATPKDIAPIVSFLLSSKASYITGQNVAVDGGWTAI